MCVVVAGLLCFVVMLLLFLLNCVLLWLLLVFCFCCSCLFVLFFCMLLSCCVFVCVFVLFLHHVRVIVHVAVCVVSICADNCSVCA